MINKIRQWIGGQWLASGIGFLLLVSVIPRFSWDLGPQVVMHIITVLLLAAFCARYMLRYRASYHSLFVLLFIIAFLSGLTSSDRAAARNELLVLADGLIAGFLVAFLKDEVKKKVLAIPVFAGFLLSMIMLATFVINPLRTLTGGGIPSNVFINANVIAGYLTLCLPLSFILWRDAGKEGQIITGILFAGIVLSRSRAAVLVAIAVIVFVMWRLKKINGRRSAMMLIAAGLVMLLLVSLYKAERAESIVSRFSWYKTAVQMFVSHPTGGIGWGNFGSMFLSYRAEPGLNTLYAHNLALQLLAETGIAGFLAFAVLLYVLIKIAKNRRNNEHDDYTEMPVVAVVALCAVNMFDYSFYIPAVMLLFFVCMGSVVTIETEERPRPLRASLIAAGIAVVAVYILLLPLRAQWNERYGITLMKKGNDGAAETHLRRALHQDPLNSSPHRSLACLYFGKYSRDKIPSDIVAAINEQLLSLQMLPQDGRSWSDLAWLYWTAGRHMKAILAMQEAVRNDRFNEGYQRSLSQFFGAVRKPAK